MRCAIITIDADGVVLTVNEMAREILELPANVRAGEPVERVLAAHPRLARVLRDSLGMACPPNRAEMELRSREDDGRTIGFTISPIPGDTGPQGVALFFKDLTLVERQEEQERLRDRLAALGQMAASLAHEIRNPLAAIEVTAGLLRRRLGGQEEPLRLVEKIAADVARLNRTVTKGLEFARVLSPERTVQPLEPLLDASVEEAANRFPDHDVSVIRCYHSGAPAVPVDGTLLRQVFVNLVVNAFEAMGARGRLTIETRPVARPDREPAAVEVVVRDTGPGIPAEVREKVFSPFVTTKKGGSGIGLAMARKIVECHHGMIDVRCEPGEETAFTVRIPCAEPDTGRGDAQDSRGRG